MNLKCILFLLASYSAYGQKFFKVSLADHYIDVKFPFSISEVVDGRKDRTTIGLVQLGANNRKEFAVFRKPGLTEIDELLMRSGAKGDSGIVMRINHIHVSEITRSLKETGKAEISADYFIRRANAYHYLGSAYSSSEGSGFDVTRAHGANIAHAIKKNLQLFNSRQVQVVPESGFTIAELSDGSEVFRDIDRMPVVMEEKFNEGFYASFDEFVENAPSISMACEINVEERIKVRCDGLELSVDVYGFSKDNQLYIFFHDDFYPLIRDGVDFYFEGPRIPGTGPAVRRGWMIAGLVGAAIASSNTAYNMVYKVDLSTGSIRSVTGIY